MSQNEKELILKIIFHNLSFFFLLAMECSFIESCLLITSIVLIFELFFSKKRNRLKRNSLKLLMYLTSNIEDYDEKKEKALVKNLSSIDKEIFQFTQLMISKNILDQSFSNLEIAENNKLFELVPNPILVVDKELKIIKLNTKASQYFGKILDKNLCKIEIFFPYLINIVNKTINRNQNNSIDLDVRSSIGKFFLVKVSPFKMNSNNKIGSILLFYDITKQKYYESLQKEFFSNISHEIKSPISSIIGFSENIKDKNLSKELKNEFINIIQQQCKRLNALISNTFSLTKEMDNTFKDFNIKDALKAAIEESKFLLLSGGFKTQLLIEDEKKNSYISNGNIESIISVFTNLISNSIKYGNKNSTIKIKLSKKNKNKEKYNSIEFKDQSNGISEKELKEITKKFYRCQESKQNKEINGQGIGLYLVSTVVEKHGGLMKIESTVGKGSKFSILIPSKENTRKTKDQKSLEKTSLIKESIS